MSHITEITTKVTDIVALRAACDELGFEFVEGQRSYRWYGRWVGDTPMPAGMTRESMGKCHHAIKVPGCEYEVGVVRQPDGSYTLAYDYWSSGGLGEKIGQDAGPIVQGYAKHKTVREAGRLGHRMLGQQRLPDGTIEVFVQQGGSW